MLKEKDATAVANLTVNIDGDTRALNKNLNEIEIKIDRIIGKLNEAIQLSHLMSQSN